MNVNVDKTGKEKTVLTKSERQLLARATVLTKTMGRHGMPKAQEAHDAMAALDKELNPPATK